MDEIAEEQMGMRLQMDRQLKARTRLREDGSAICMHFTPIFEQFPLDCFT